MSQDEQSRARIRAVRDLWAVLNGGPRLTPERLALADAATDEERDAGMQMLHDEVQADNDAKERRVAQLEFLVEHGGAGAGGEGEAVGQLPPEQRREYHRLGEDGADDAPR